MASDLKCPLCQRFYSRNGLIYHIAKKHPDFSIEAVSTKGDAAKLAEDTAAKLAEKDAEIARLTGELDVSKSAKSVSKLAESTTELSDQERFDQLVEDITSLTAEGKARLAETTGWTIPIPALAAKSAVATPAPTPDTAAPALAAALAETPKDKTALVEHTDTAVKPRIVLVYKGKPIAMAK